MGSSVPTEHFAHGDRVLQTAPIGLNGFMRCGVLYVVTEVDNDLELSYQPDGPPLAEPTGEPQHFPRNKFMRLAA